MGQRASNYLVVPLCPSCHRDKKLGWHGEKVMWKIYKMDEMDALAKTIEMLNTVEKLKKAIDDLIKNV